MPIYNIPPQKIIYYGTYKCLEYMQYISFVLSSLIFVKTCIGIERCIKGECICVFYHF